MNKDLWTKLKETTKPILLYGMGNGADKIIKVLEDNAINFQGVFASDGFVRDKSFHGFKIMSYTQAKEKFGDFIVLLCFGSAREDVRENVLKIAGEMELYAPDVAVYGSTLFDLSYAKKHKKELEWVYNRLADQPSKNTFENTVKYKISGDIKYLLDCETKDNEPYENFFNLTNEEIFMDLGAYRGDTVQEFINRVKDYSFIYAVEPDYKTYLKLLKNTENIPKIKTLNALVSNIDGKQNFSMASSRGSAISCIGKETDSLTVDGILKGEKATYIKMDIEGAESLAIQGAKNTIINHKPKMLISCYHRSEDFIDIPQKVFEIRDDYKIYMRHFRSLPAWDTCFYFV